MPSFTEYVRLIADGNEAIAVINRINEAIAKLRREASQPINVKIRPEEEAINGERRLRGEKRQTQDAELVALQKKKAEIAAIKAMNKEQGNPSHNIRFGNQESLAQGQRFNEQLSETTRRINRMADAHKHISNVAKDADVEVSRSLAERMAAQVANRSEKADVEAIREAVRAEQARKAAVMERQRQEMDGAKRIYAMEQDKLKLEQAQAREAKQKVAEQERAINRARRERETQLAATRESGIRGVAGEAVRDIRRNMMYGGIGIGEHMVSSGFESSLDRSKEIEQQYQTGRTPEERRSIQERAERYSNQYAMMSKTEGMTLQRHAMGEVGDFAGGQKLSDLAAPFVALRTSAIGAEQALTENQKIMKGFNELGWVKNPQTMKSAYESLAKMSQVEGANFEPDSWLQIIRMAKSAKFAMTPEAMMNLAPLISIGEGAGRTGNEFAMLFKTLAFSGKALDNSIGKTNHLQYVNGTDLSDNKGGFNPELAKDVASGTPEGIKKFNALLDSAAKTKGVDPSNALDFKQWLTHVFANQSAQELAMWFHEKEDFVEKQMGMYGKARGTEANQGIENRDMNSAIAGAKAKFSDATAAMTEPLKGGILTIINAARNVEQFAAAHPAGSLGATAGLVVAGGAAIAQSAYENPGQAAQIGLLTTIAANTGVTAANTGIAATSSIGLLSKLGVAAGVAAGAYDIYKAGADIKQWWENYKLKNAAQSPEGIAAYNKNTIDDDQKAVKLAQAQVDAHEKQMRDQPHPAGASDQMAKQYGDQLAAAIAKLVRDQANPLKFNQEAKDKINGVVDPRADPHNGGRGINTTYGPSMPTYHTQFGVTDLPSNSQTGAIAASTAKDAIAKINSAGNETASAMTGAGEAIKGGASGAAGSIAAGGEAVAGALNQAAAAIAAAGSRAAAQGAPQVAPQSTGASPRGPR